MPPSSGRIRLQAGDLAGLRFHNDIAEGFGGAQLLLDDAPGNPVELFEPPAL